MLIYSASYALQHMLLVLLGHCTAAQRSHEARGLALVDAHTRAHAHTTVRPAADAAKHASSSSRPKAPPTTHRQTRAPAASPPSAGRASRWLSQSAPPGSCGAHGCGTARPSPLAAPAPGHGIRQSGTVVAGVLLGECVIQMWGRIVAYSEQAVQLQSMRAAASASASAAVAAAVIGGGVVVVAVLLLSNSPCGAGTYPAALAYTNRDPDMLSQCDEPSKKTPTHATVPRWHHAKACGSACNYVGRQQLCMPTHASSPNMPPEACQTSNCVKLSHAMDR